MAVSDRLSALSTEQKLLGAVLIGLLLVALLMAGSALIYVALLFG